MNKPYDIPLDSPARRGPADSGLADARILELVALAIDLEAFEAESPPRLRLHTTNRDVPRNARRLAWFRTQPRRSAGLLVGLAAGVALCGLSLLSLFPQSPVKTSPQIVMKPLAPIGPEPVIVFDPPAAISDHTDAVVTETGLPPAGQSLSPANIEYIVLAIYQDSAGEIGCLQWERRTLAHGQSLSDLRPGELLGLSANVTCPARPERLVVAGITGSPDALPRSDGAAEHLALCIARSPDHCSTDVSSFDSRSLTCLPHGLTAVVESVAMTGR